MRILLLGGTMEAKALAERLSRDGVDTLTSLAGRVSAQYEGKVRIGGFGGVAGLVRTITEGAFTVVVDATHPFAARISPNAVSASERAGVPYLRLERPAWMPVAGDDWRSVSDLEEAAAELPAGARAFLAVGAGGVEPFLRRTDVSLTIRVIKTPDTGAHPCAHVVSARGPFQAVDERILWDRHGIDWLVTKNAGGSATLPKLMVARERGVPVIMVDRPRGQPKPDATTVDEAMAIIAHHRSATAFGRKM